MDFNILNKTADPGPPMVDNFTLLYYDSEDKIVDCEERGTSELTEEEAYRKDLKRRLDDVAKLRDEIINKNQARYSTEQKLKIQLNDSRNQTKHFGVLSSNQSALMQAIDSNYKRLKLLYEKIYHLHLELQKRYISLSEKLERRSEELLEMHKSARLASTALYEHKKNK
ncbi:hypothetical protein MACJ_000036 [Theileria orientalis]|uniref:Uncharacterized protein n=1 Tax=Theileria orientalis TaxID=68886 RepID=A0A976QR25_THEOR|nr:hypothetical protein MACJ_000036 [Theileria orientalis]